MDAAEVLERPEARVWATPEEAAQMRANGLQLRPAAGEAGAAAAGGGSGGRRSRVREWVLSLQPVGVSKERYAPWLGRPLGQEDVDRLWLQRADLSSNKPGPGEVDVTDRLHHKFINSVRVTIMKKCIAFRFK
ncbi:hypothetical protein MNEG_8888 [Monoraphidium neglectum]|uniref:Uncharacterized protein n=1 Tax=Monoraphidium neglectum TaxID=145388 RepID=A0A0D2MED6_9CHLO|nr:hypothetical protein MNEG_8888 [Monoraphidium neglectum]KIY99076.1 hypothetical protein MNEG_8888 [Monoraphidium neglectum]|eukprot:XP_013898096.1 hypothetical protein MNEG_8888 [Monoraphidium neglectum]